ncbi:hypothetical protein VNI00_003756 [Paramarasmius palmivorus]|uniref:Uncharacterized protein n=1 Tax=Paramarasmius palmivorus TaxID=297713 RepID=A0AAW0DQ16_9AGAR
MPTHLTNDSLRYLLSDRVAAPAFLTTSFAFAVVIYGLTLLIRGVDLWLHLAATATVFNSTVPGVPSDSFKYGIAFNESLCTPLDIEIGGCLVGQDSGWAASTPSVQQSGWLIASNVSSSVIFHSGQEPLFVVTIHDEEDLAAIVPVKSNETSVWSAPSFGIRAKCKNITPQCVPQRGVYNCSAAGYPFLPFNNSNIGYVSNERIPGHIMAKIGDKIVGGNNGPVDAGPGVFPLNPQSVGVQFEWFILNSDTATLTPNEEFSNTPFDAVGVNSDHSNNFANADPSKSGTYHAFADCEMAFYNLTIRYDMGVYNLDGTPEPSNGPFTATMWGPLLNQMINTHLHANLQGRLLAPISQERIMAAVSQEISRLSLAVFAGAVINAPVHNLSFHHSDLVGRYPIAPVIAYTVLLFVYSFVSIGIFVWASIMKTRIVQAPDGTKATSMELTQLQLTDPMMIVAMTFPPANGQDTIHTDPLNSFVEDPNTPRLVVTTEDGPTSDRQFKVRQRIGFNKEGEDAS